STSVGKCLLAWLPKHDVEAIAKQHGLKKRTPETLTSLPKLLADLEHVKQSGYAVDDEEDSLGARCLGVPIFDTLGNVTAARGAPARVSYCRGWQELHVVHSRRGSLGALRCGLGVGLLDWPSQLAG